MSLPHSPSQRLQLFETCAGRLSAEVEHLWLFDTAEADRRQTVRDGFDRLIDAVMPDALDWGMPPELPMSWRVTAKATQAELLSTAAFDLEPARRTRARTIARARIAECDGLLIG